MATRAPDDPTRPVRKSVAEPGDLADKPKDLTNVTVGEDGDPDGFLTRWRAGEWVYAEVGSYDSLDTYL